MARVIESPVMEVLEFAWGWIFKFDCDACFRTHAVTVHGDADTGVKWTWNGDLEKPTFRPAILCQADRQGVRCHLEVTEGRIAYLADCGHLLAGKTVPMGTVR
jgi:hypothetical protein